MCRKAGRKTGADAFDNVALASHRGFPVAIRHLQTPPWSTVQLRITRAFCWSSSATMVAVDAVSTIRTDPNQDQGRAILGNPRNFWLWAKDGGFDLTHPSTPDSDPVRPRIKLQCAPTPVVIDPAKTALLVLDF